MSTSNILKKKSLLNIRLINQIWKNKKNSNLIYFHWPGSILEIVIFLLWKRIGFKFDDQLYITL